jgi:hypothetical protein
VVSLLVFVQFSSSTLTNFPHIVSDALKYVERKKDRCKDRRDERREDNKQYLLAFLYPLCILGSLRRLKVVAVLSRRIHGFALHDLNQNLNLVLEAGDLEYS